MKTYLFPIVTELDAEGVYIVSFLMFKHCHAAGKTIDEALADLKDVVDN